MSKVEMKEKSLTNGLSSKAKVCNATGNGNSSNASARSMNRNTAQNDGQDTEHSSHPSNAGQSNKSGLDSHTNTSAERLFKCTYCEKFYKDPEYLKVHERIHTGEKPYKCGECGKCFAKSSNLVTHKKIHSSDRPHKCDQCEKSFKRSQELKHHKMRLHSEGERPYKCCHCDISFIISSELKTHVRIHSGEKPFKCTYCPKSFRTAELIVGPMKEATVVTNHLNAPTVPRHSKLFLNERFIAEPTLVTNLTSAHNVISHLPKDSS